MEKTEVVTVQKAGVKKIRYHYIDWLRIIGSINVFLYHLLRIFDEYPYTLKNSEACPGVGVIAFLLHIWNIPLVFFLAGGSCKFSLLKRTKTQFIIERFKRLGVPFIAGALLLVPLQRYVEYLNQGKFVGSLPEFIPWYFASQFLNTKYTFDPMWLLPVGEHLWFLGALFIILTACVPVFTYLNGDKGKKLIDQLARLAEKPGGILIFGVPLMIIRIGLQPIFVAYSSWCDFVFWLLIIIYGYIMLSDRRFTQFANRDKYIALFATFFGIAALLLCLAYGDFMRWILSPDYSLGAILYHTLWGAVTWSVLIVFLGMGTAYLDKGHSLLPKLSEAIMPFYILNFTIMMLTGYYVVAWKLPAIEKILLVGLLTISIVYGLCYLLMTKMPWLRPVFGMRPVGSKVEKDKSTLTMESKIAETCK